VFLQRKKQNYYIERRKLEFIIKSLEKLLTFVLTDDILIVVAAEATRNIQKIN